MTLRAVAEAADVSYSTLSYAEIGRHGVSRRVAARLADVFDWPELVALADESEDAVSTEGAGPVELPPRPQTRADCAGGERPCPWVGCKWHLWLVSAGARTIRHQRRALEDLPASCALDVADEGPHTLDEVGQALGITRERVRQIEEAALPRLRRGLERAGVL
jgi:transcriptional regulator with XRE-family HTH domain